MYLLFFHSSGLLAKSLYLLSFKGTSYVTVKVAGITHWACCSTETMSQNCEHDSGVNTARVREFDFVSARYDT